MFVEGYRRRRWEGGWGGCGGGGKAKTRQGEGGEWGVGGGDGGVGLTLRVRRNRQCVSVYEHCKEFLLKKVLIF